MTNATQNIKINMERKVIRRSEPLTKNEHKALKKYVHTFYTKMDAADALGINRQVLDLVLLKGTGRSDTIQKIRQHLQVTGAYPNAA